MKKLVVILGGIIFLTLACSMKQDPMADKPEEVKNGRLPQNKVGLPPPINSDVIRINSVNKYTFQERSEGKISILATVLEEGYTPEVQIANLEEFPGAFFDAQKGLFVWTPPNGFIFDGLSKTLDLRVRVFAKNPNSVDAKIFTREKAIEIVVTKYLGAPEINVVDFPQSFYENTEYKFKVVVHDEDAGPDKGTYPRLIITEPEHSRVSLRPFVTINGVSPNFVTRDFTYSVTLNTGKTYLTANYDYAGFGIVAVSRYNVISATRELSGDIRASYGTPSSSWKRKIRIPVGSNFSYPFFLYENSRRADFNIEINDSLPEGASINCEASSVDGVLLCEFSWKASKKEPLRSGTFNMNVTAFNKSYSQIKSVTDTLYLDYEIVAELPPEPALSPIPKGQKQELTQ